MDSTTGVCEFLCDRRFHQSFTLPPNPETNRSKPFRVSYADYGDHDSDAVVLLCGGIMTSRFCYSPLDQAAKANIVRIIHPDRPGIGGTDQVEQRERISVWLEMIPKLLDHLGVKYISLASHSFGNIYALNIMLTYPHLLHPTSPYVAFFSPFVHPQHTGIPLRAVEYLPRALIGKYASIARFLSDKVIPLAGSPANLVHSIKDALTHHHPYQDMVPLVPGPLSPKTSRTDLDSSGQSSGPDLNNVAVATELRNLIMTYLFAENIEGISDDAQLSLKPHSFSVQTPTADLDYVIPLFKNIIIQERRDGEVDRAWLIETFFPEHDSIIGEQGRLWYDKCWAGTPDSPIEVDDEMQSSLVYKSIVVPNANHSTLYPPSPAPEFRRNHILDPVFGASIDWLKRVRGVFPAELDPGREVICTAASKWGSFSYLLSKIKDHPCPIRTKVRALHAAHDVYPLLDPLESNSDCSSVVAYRKGKRGGRKGALVDYDPGYNSSS